MKWTRLPALTALLSLLLLAAACSGDATTADPPATTTTDASAEGTPNPAVTPNTMATVAPDAMASPDPTQTAEPANPQQALIDQGKIIYEVTAGGVGCAFCHGLDGRGKAEVASPPNRGATEEIIWNALETRPQMTFITLSDHEIKAVAPYLQWLDTQP